MISPMEKAIFGFGLQSIPNLYLLQQDLGDLWIESLTKIEQHMALAKAICERMTLGRPSPINLKACAELRLIFDGNGTI